MRTIDLLRDRLAFILRCGGPDSVLQIWATMLPRHLQCSLIRIISRPHLASVLQTAVSTRVIEPHAHRSQYLTPSRMMTNPQLGKTVLGRSSQWRRQLAVLELVRVTWEIRGG